MEKLVASGNAIPIETVFDNSGNIDVHAFSEKIKSVIGEDSANNWWLEQYKDITAIPVPLHLCTRFVRITYTQLISVMIEDPSIMYRELSGSGNKNSNNYVLSSAALVALHKIGFKLDVESKSIVIPSTLARQVSDDAECIISENKRETVASMGIQNGKLYFIEASEDEKQRNMVEAVALKDFADLFLKRDNDRDIKDSNGFDLKEVLGIADYDALSIAKRDGITLISAEVPTSAISCYDDVNIDCVCISDFLSSICGNWDSLIKYAKKMMEYRFIIPISTNTVKVLIDIYIDSTDEVKMQIIEAWKDVFDIPQNDKKYKMMLVDHFKRILAETKDYIEGMNPILRILMMAVLSYSGYSIQLYLSKTGEVTAKLIKNE